jgi:putative molybdopterin biosynthesis protein
MMSVYLHDIPLDVAKERLFSALEKIGQAGILEIEQIDLNEFAVGRVLAKPVWAKISSPHYHASAMDGFAVRAEDTTGALLNNPISLNCSGEIIFAAYVDTGDPLPDWANAVIPVENVEPFDSSGSPSTTPRKPDLIRIRASVTPWSHVRPMGEDMVATQLVLPAGHILRPVDLGAIAASGHSDILVSRKPRVAIIPTGTELIPIGQEIKKGDIIEFNSQVLAGQINEWGGAAMRYEITPDDFDLLCQRVSDAAINNDLILLNAGSSAGSEDYSATIVETLGELLVHGVAVRPGHPVIVGLIDHQKAQQYLKGKSDQISSEGKTLIIGVPGYPVSAALTGEIFVEPIIALWLGRQPGESTKIKATLTRKVTSPAGDDDYMRVAVGWVGDKLLAAPLSRGSGVITSLVNADGIAILPRGTQGLPAGAEIDVQLYRPVSDLRRTIFAIGSHDVILDLLAQYLSGYNRRLASANVGSMGGLVALKRGEAHFAGSHLLDPETGEYNLSYIHRYLSEVPVKVIAFVGRTQGLMVPKGNPKGIFALDDLIRDDVRYVNRQRGAGTRVLLDYHLGLLGISQDQIIGYSQEEYTHLSIAAAITSGRADCGLGIQAAANALDLEFIPLFKESYQLIVPDKYYQDALLEPLWNVVNDREFQRKVSQMPGYDISEMGKLVADVNGKT